MNSGAEVPKKQARQFLQLLDQGHGQRLVQLSLRDVTFTFAENEASGLSGVGAQIEVSMRCPHQSHGKGGRPEFTGTGNALDALSTALNGLYVHYDAAHLSPDQDTMRRLGKAA